MNDIVKCPMCAEIMTDFDYQSHDCKNTEAPMNCKVAHGRIIISYDTTSVDIDMPGAISYGRVRDMYTTGDGYGVQCHPDHEQEVKVICDKIVEQLDTLYAVGLKIMKKFEGGSHE